MEEQMLMQEDNQQQVQPVDEQPAPQAALEREAELTRREADITRRELRARALETLAGRQLPAELAELLDYTDEGSCAASLSRVQRTWQQAVQRGVEARVAGNAPRTGAGKSAAHGGMREAISAYYNK